MVWSEVRGVDIVEKSSKRRGSKDLTTTKNLFKKVDRLSQRNNKRKRKDRLFE